MITSVLYLKLKKLVKVVTKKHRLSGNKLFYLATLPEHFDTITSYLDKSHLAKGKGWSKMVYEKPFGNDLESAKKINKCIARVFKEEQVFRIDHYLGKELVGNLAMLRFTNRVMEPLWNKEHIESVQILLSEKIGIEGRGNFYDKYGALKDVVQNHMLQILALTAMEAPAKLTGEFMRNEKAKVLKKIKVHKVLRGQYQGYLQEKGVKSNSSAETFAALHLEVQNKRWQGVPFYLKTGKYLTRKDTSIHIKFKPVHCLLQENCPTDSNYLTVRIQPDEGFDLELFSKSPGTTTGVTPVKMDFCHSCLFKLKTPEAYQILLEDVIKGEQSLFVRNDEIEYSWKIIDKIEKKKGTVYTYKQGSKGPEELIKFAREHKMRWRG